MNVYPIQEGWKHFNVTTRIRKGKSPPKLPLCFNVCVCVCVRVVNELSFLDNVTLKLAVLVPIRSPRSRSHH